MEKSRKSEIRHDYLCRRCGLLSKKREDAKRHAALNNCKESENDPNKQLNHLQTELDRVTAELRYERSINKLLEYILKTHDVDVGNYLEREPHSLHIKGFPSKSFKYFFHPVEEEGDGEGDEKGKGVFFSEQSMSIEDFNFSRGEALEPLPPKKPSLRFKKILDIADSKAKTKTAKTTKTTKTAKTANKPSSPPRNQTRQTIKKGEEDEEDASETVNRDSIQELEDSNPHWEFETEPVDIEEANTMIKSLQEYIDTNPRYYRKTLINQQRILLSLIQWKSFREYEEAIFRWKKKFDSVLSKRGLKLGESKKIESSVLSPLNKRILKHNNYFDSVLEFDTIKYISDNVSYSVVKGYEPYSPLQLQQLQTYMLCVFSLEDILSRYFKENMNYMFVRPVFFNKTEEFTFYYLQSCEEKSKNWILDSNLEELTFHINHNLYSYGVSLFRHIYRDIFHSNQYFSDMFERTPLCSTDLLTLLQNLFLIQDIPKLNVLLKKILKRKILNPTEEDKINSHVEDKGFHKNMRKYGKMKQSDLLRELFTDIQNKDVEHILSFVDE